MLFIQVKEGRIIKRLFIDYNYLHQQMHNYFFIKHTPRLHVST
jgi:hypothetical protein